jgi:glutamine---fructose-6-phosphate transaminase (isomerizing)
MCGIFGLIVNSQSSFKNGDFSIVLERLFLLSETRGKDASGLMFFNDSEMTVLKRPIRANKFIHSHEFKKLIKQVVNYPRQKSKSFGFMGHARMVTNGSEEEHANNQPVIRKDMVVLHNGIVVNDEELWRQNPSLKRSYVVDSEVILGLMEYYLLSGETLYQAFRHTWKQLEGANSVALMNALYDVVILATSNGSLYFAESQTGNELVFASEKFILEQLLKYPAIQPLFENARVIKVQPGTAYIFPFDQLRSRAYSLKQQDDHCTISPVSSRSIRDLRITNSPNPIPLSQQNTTSISNNDFFIEKVNNEVSRLRRCTRCILPETFPFIQFDEQGVCNICRSHTPLIWKGRDALEEALTPYRRTDNQPDCLVPISGGRDSCYGLHYIKRTLGMNPVAYTYDWGMVTDLARRNISRMCGALGIEHVLVSADIKTKRKYIRQNVTAWLKRPALGTVPLFMAGDKQFFYYATMLKKQMDLGITLFSMNPLERTDFKVGYCDIDEINQKQEKHYSLSSFNQMRLGLYYGKEFLLNPAYFNSSLIDSAFAFISYYGISKDYTTLYEYEKWEEKKINSVLIGEYEWEVAKDTQSTWRIGDGTASFYNYIYYTMGGFCENDTFRSNQIREGMISREEALQIAERDNQPRYDAIQWYCKTIGIDMIEALNRINSAPKLYSL